MNTLSPLESVCSLNSGNAAAGAAPASGLFVRSVSAFAEMANVSKSSGKTRREVFIDGREPRILHELTRIIRHEAMPEKADPGRSVYIEDFSVRNSAARRDDGA